MALAAAQLGPARSVATHRRALAFRRLPGGGAGRARQALAGAAADRRARSACCRWRCCNAPSGASIRPAPSPSSRPSPALERRRRRAPSSRSRTGPMTARRSRRRRRARCSRTCSPPTRPARGALARRRRRSSIPAALPCPLLNIVSTTDRIVPAATAVRAGERLDLALGHVGMVVGAPRPRSALGAAGRPGFPALQQTARGAANPISGDSITMTDVVITAAKRTPVGSFLGAFAATPAHELGRIAIEAALAQAGVAPEDVSEVILGQVLTAGQGQNPARQASMAAGIPKEVPAWGVNQVCGSGLRAVALASPGDPDRRRDHRRRRRPGEHEPFHPRPESARRHQDGRSSSLVDTMIKDGLTDVFNDYHMGITAENLAEQYQVTRDEQDAFAAASQNKAAAARAAGRFKDEIAAGHRQGPQGRHRSSTPTNISATASSSRRPRRPAPRLQEGRHRHRRQRLGPQRRRRRAGADEPRGSRAPRRADPRPRRELGLGRRRSLDHGHRPGPGLEEGAGEGRLDDRRPRPDRGQRGLRRPGAGGRQGARLGRRPRSTSMAARSPSATRSAPRAPASSPPCSTRCSSRDAKKGLATLCIGGGMGIALCVERD